MSFMGDNFILVQCIGIVSKLGIADLLSEGPRPVEELAGEEGVDAEALYTVIRALSTPPSPDPLPLGEDSSVPNGIRGSGSDSCPH